MHLLVASSKSRFPASGRQLFQGIITSPKREEALNLVKRRFIKDKTVRNDVNIISDTNMHEQTTHIILDKSLFHVVKNRPHEYDGGVIIQAPKLGIHPFLENPKKLRSRHWQIFVV
jgi:hypothetical protein